MSRKAKSDEMDLKSLTEQLSLLLNEQRDLNRKVDGLVTKVANLEDLLEKAEERNATLRRENQDLRTTLVKRDGEVEQLRNKALALEGHNRSFSVRVSNLSISGDETDNFNVRHQLYTKVFYPILQGAVQSGKRQSIPSEDQLIELAHVLPGRADKAKPIICRFISRTYKGLIMSLKKDHAPRVTGSRAGDAARAGRPPPDDLPHQ